MVVASTVTTIDLERGQSVESFQNRFTKHGQRDTPRLPLMDRSFFSFAGSLDYKHNGPMTFQSALLAFESPRRENGERNLEDKSIIFHGRTIKIITRRRGNFLFFTRLWLYTSGDLKSKQL